MQSTYDLISEIWPYESFLEKTRTWPEHPSEKLTFSDVGFWVCTMIA
jgi:hypothetical protein